MVSNLISANPTNRFEPIVNGILLVGGVGFCLSVRTRLKLQEQKKTMELAP